MHRRFLLAVTLALGIALCGAAARAQEPVPDPAVVDLDAQVEGDTVRITAELANLGERQMFPETSLVVYVDGAVAVPDTTFGPLDPGDVEPREWPVPIEEAWRGRRVDVAVIIEADDLPDLNPNNNQLSRPLDIPAALGGGGFSWQWPLLVIPPVVIGIGGAEALKIRRRRVRQANSKDSEPPKECRPGETHTERRCQPDLARRRFTAVELREGRQLAGEPIELLNAALKAQRRGDNDRLHEGLDAAAHLVTDGLRALLTGDGRPRDIAVIGHVEGRSVKCEFTHRVCLGAGWQVKSTWTARIKDRCEVEGGTLPNISAPLPADTHRDITAALHTMVEQTTRVPPGARARRRDARTL